MITRLVYNVNDGFLGSVPAEVFADALENEVVAVPAFRDCVVEVWHSDTPARVIAYQYHDAAGVDIVGQVDGMVRRAIGYCRANQDGQGAG